MLRFCFAMVMVMVALTCVWYLPVKCIGQEVLPLGHEAWVQKLFYTPDGQRIISYSAASSIAIFYFRPRADENQKSRNNNYFGVVKPRLVVWNRNRKQVESTILPEETHVKLMGLAMGGQVFVTEHVLAEAVAFLSEDPTVEDGSRWYFDRRIRYWDISGKRIQNQSYLGLTDQPFVDSALSPTGVIAAADSLGKVTLWTADGEKVLTLNQSAGLIRKIMFSPSGALVAIYGDDEDPLEEEATLGNPLIEVFDARDGKLKAALTVRSSDDDELGDGECGVMSAIFPGEETLAATSSTHNTMLFDLRDAKPWCRIGPEKMGREMQQGEVVRASPSGDRLVLVSSMALGHAYLETRMQLWDTSQGGREIRCEGSAMKAACGRSEEAIVLSADGRFLAVPGCDHNIDVIRTSDGTLLTTLTNTRGHINCVAFSPDGKELVASFSPDEKESVVNGDVGGVQVWDLSTVAVQ